MSPLLCCMEGNVLGLMEEPHVEDIHEESADLQVLVKRYEEDNFGQALMKCSSLLERGLITFLMDQQIKFLIHPLIGWI